MKGFTNFVSEAYDIIPKSEGEIDELDIPHNKEKLKALFTDVVTQTGVADPIAISKSTKEKGIKIMRYRAYFYIIISIVPPVPNTRKFIASMYN